MKVTEIEAAMFVDGTVLAEPITVVGNCDHVECRDSVSGLTIQIQQGDQTIVVGERQIMELHLAVLRNWTFT